MKPRDIFDLIMVAALFGAAFLFLRVAAPEFGAIPLIAVRLALAALFLIPIVVARRGVGEILQNWRPITVMAIVHYAVPFSLFAYALLTLTGSFTAIVNASSPLFAGVIAWLWLGERMPVLRIVGILIGFAGVVLLVWDKVDLNLDVVGVATVAAVSASFCYGIAVNLAKKHLSGVSPLAVSTGSMVVGAVLLLPFAVWLWPDTAPSANAWFMAAALAIVCTSFAFILYFRLIASVGPTKAITVTFLIPVFAGVLGALLLDEPITLSMIAGGLVILLGTGLSTGLLQPKGPAPP